MRAVGESGDGRSKGGYSFGYAVAVVALVGLLLAGYSVWFTHGIMARHMVFLNLMDEMRGRADTIQKQLTAEDSTHSQAALDALVDDDLTVINRALLDRQAWHGLLESDADIHFRADLLALKREMEAWKGRATLAVRSRGIGQKNASGSEVAHVLAALIGDMESDMRAAVKDGGRTLARVNLGVMVVLGVLFGAVVVMLRRHQQSTEERNASLQGLVDVRTRHLKVALVENESQMRELVQANNRITLFSQARDSLAASAKLLFDTGDYNHFYTTLVDDVMRLSGARYGAFAMLGDDGVMEHFIARGITEEAIGLIGRQPQGRGLLSALYKEKSPIRVANIARDPSSCGFPQGHPPMTSLLGLPVLINGITRGVIYLADKNGGEPFTADDETFLDIYGKEVAHTLERQDLENALRRDNLERISAQKALAQTSARFQSLIDNSPAVIYTASPDDFGVTFVSDNIERILGLKPSDIVGGADLWAGLVHPDDLADVHAKIVTLMTEGEVTLECRLRRTDGDYYWIHDAVRVVPGPDGAPAELLGVVSDITERKWSEHELQERHADLQRINKRLEEAHNQLLQAEKLASIGQLAAGVAHEINNPVGYISANLASMQKYVDDLFRVLDVYGQTEAALAGNTDILAAVTAIKNEVEIDYLKQDIVDLLRESQEGVGRVRQIVRDLKDFSHVEEQEWAWADLHKGIDSTLNIVHNEIKYKAAVVKEYGDIPHIECRMHQLNQVFMNLLVNAAHAIEEHGTITVRTGMQQEWVWVEIEDTGKGIPPEHIKRIFDPFFTTKPVGKGTGLGLSLSYGIVNKHGGRIEVDSVVGKGTRFRVFLPTVRPVTESVGRESKLEECVA